MVLINGEKSRSDFYLTLAHSRNQDKHKPRYFRRKLSKHARSFVALKCINKQISTGRAHEDLYKWGLEDF